MMKAPMQEVKNRIAPMNFHGKLNNLCQNIKKWWETVFISWEKEKKQSDGSSDLKREGSMESDVKSGSKRGRKPSSE